MRPRDRVQLGDLLQHPWLLQMEAEGPDPGPQGEFQDPAPASL